MADDFEEQAWVKFGVAAELSKQYAADQRSFLENLATLLESVLPQETEITRKGGLFSKKTVQRITVTLSENRFILEDVGRGALQAARVRVVRGIALKTESIPVEEWVTALSDHIDERARTNQAARDALARLVG
jgi:hypothetical protein